jgi:hypothetical protein
MKCGVACLSRNSEQNIVLPFHETPEELHALSQYNHHTNLVDNKIEECHLL